MNKNSLVKLFASGFYSSYSPIVPGTTGTIPCWLIAYFLVAGDQTVVISLAVAFTVLSVWLSFMAEDIYGHDAKKIVIDEWAGMMIALILIPYSLVNYLIAFIAFRGFDAIKIFPANVAEKLPGGWGVTADDIVAGVQANLSTLLAIYILNHYLWPAG
jgi:phosphatidylglycerophosphatase A